MDDLNDEEIALSDVVKLLFDFARMRFQVVKVSQLGVNYTNTFIPVNVHTDAPRQYS